MSDCKRSDRHTSPGKGYDGMILNQSDFLSHDQVQMLGPDLNLTEMSEGDYTHLRHIIQTHMETQAEVSDMSADQNTSMAKVSPLPTIQAIDLSTTSDGHEVILPGEKTPPYGEVPGFVLAKIRGEDKTSPSGTGSLPAQTKGPSTARVCLEKRFNSIPGTLRHQDLQSTVCNNFLTVVQQPSETQEATAHCHLQRSIRCDIRNELSGPFIDLYKPVTNMSAPAISHLEPNPHQSLIIPKGLPLNLCPDRVEAKSYIANTISPSDDKKTSPSPKSVQRAKSRTTKDMCNSVGDTGSSVRKRGHRVVPLSLGRERHNSKERERSADTDKVRTLQWTAAYLRYINQMYGDMLKKEFERAFTDKDGLKLDPSSVNDLILRDTQNIPMSVEP